MAQNNFYNSDLVSPNSMHEVDVPDNSTFGGRVLASTSPLMGPPGWTAGDMTPSYCTPATVVDSKTGNYLSDPYNPSANGIELYSQFSDGTTSCDIAILSDDGTGNYTVVATFIGKNALKAGGMTVGQWPTGISLLGRNIKIQLLNFVGAGLVTVKVQRLN